MAGWQGPSTRRALWNVASAIASASPCLPSSARLWRRLAKRMVMGDERAWLTVRTVEAVAECMACFPRALSLRIVGDARAGDIAVLGSRSVMRLAIAKNTLMRGCEGLGQLVGLRDLYIRKRWGLHASATARRKLARSR